jgi:carbamoyltransferase
MNTIGIAGRHQQAAAALAVDGRIVAATSEQVLVRVSGAAYSQTNGFPFAAVQSCLDSAGLAPTDIEALLVVHDRAYSGSEASDIDAAMDGDLSRGRDLRGWLSQQTVRPVDPVSADAAQTAAARREDTSLVFVVGLERGSAGVFVARDGTLERRDRLAAVDPLLCALRQVGRLLGCSAWNVFEELDQLAMEGEPEHSAAFQSAIGWNADGVLLDDSRLQSTIGDLAGQAGRSLMYSEPGNVSVQYQRRSIAASVVARVGEVLADVAGRLAQRAGTPQIGFGGALFSMSALNAQLRRSLGPSIYFSAVPERIGRAVGAALGCGAPGANRLRTLALGPEFSESDIKVVLENCRLDYLYEPDWTRLLTRVSRLLADGKTVAWFQGPMEFGPRSLGHRSILCDPSNRYARDNVNRYLRQPASERRMVVSILESVADECLEQPVSAPFVPSEAIVRSRWRDRLRAALDHRNRLFVQTVNPEATPAFADLLRRHHQRTGVPGIINTPLSGGDEPIACTPRDAVRTTFSSATDALVIGRFLLMKDYWLLRSDSAA